MEEVLSGVVLIRERMRQIRAAQRRSVRQDKYLAQSLVVLELQQIHIGQFPPEEDHD